MTDHIRTPRDVPEQDPPPPLAEWLLERLAEEDEEARELDGAHWDSTMDASDIHRHGQVQDHRGALIAQCTPHLEWDGVRIAEHIARHDPARVLAEVAAKRRIVEREDLHGEDDGTLRLLALPYADHPTYRAEYWTP